ncbi:MAG: class I SAM-dependent methyltransferase [Cyanobacteria bacterium P01_F01_bin.150]
MINSSATYDMLSDDYDDMVDKTRDYSQVGKVLSDFIGDRRTLLEVGVGTGLVVKALLDINPNYEIWGIDNHQPLLDQAKAKFDAADNVQFHLQDVLNLSLPKTFDVAYSRGGASMFINTPDGCWFASHLSGRENNLKSLKLIAEHLEDGGLFIINADRYRNYDNELKEGVVHHRRIEQQTIDGEDYMVFDLSISHNQKVVNRQVLKLFLLSYQDAKELFMEAGLTPVSIEADGSFHIYTKGAAQ